MALNLPTLRWSPWSDHLPLWIAVGATLSTGLYAPGEQLVMVLPLVAAAGVQLARRDLAPYQRWFEGLALLFFLGDLARGQGLFSVAIHTLCVLAAIRLALPRETVHQRQLLLIGFLLFLTAAIGTTDLLFLLWACLWACAAAQALLRQSWEPSATLKRGALSSPPYARIPRWVGASLLIGAVFFLALPRVALGFRPGLLAMARAPGQAGLGEHLDLSGGGPISPNPEVALRITPSQGVDPQADPTWPEGLQLLRGITLETAQSLRWEPSDLTPPLVRTREHPGALARAAEFLYTPSSHGILALPPGLVRVTPRGMLAYGPGASLRWRYPRVRTAALAMTWIQPGEGLPESRLTARRLDQLTRMEPEHDAARRVSFHLAPGLLPTPQLARTLEAALQGWSYTLDNPSGSSPNPLQDFLERSRAGHCEYFASALALMLRARGVPSRVVNGYRLGPWIPEGGYYRVSQDEAHSWVEYWDQGQWWTLDPTPRSPGATPSGARPLGRLQRWLDAFSYRWDRHVVRYSDQDQRAGLAWIQARLQGWEWRWETPSRTALTLVALAIVGWVTWRFRARWGGQPPASPGRIQALRPLLGCTRRAAPPRPGETARTWLLRLGELRPERSAALARLAEAVDLEAYGAGPASARALAKAEARAWRGWKAGPS